MPIGTVKFFNASKGYGFIQPDGGGSDAFVHISAVERSGLTGLNENQRISYDLEQDQRGKTSAVNLRNPDEPVEASPTVEQDLEPSAEVEAQASGEQSL